MRALSLIMGAALIGATLYAAALAGDVIGYALAKPIVAASSGLQAQEGAR